MGEVISVLVGTTKGAFVLTSDPDTTDWVDHGPQCGGWPINHVIAGPDGKTLWAAGGSDWTGAGVWRSCDGGRTWALSKLSNGKFDVWLENDPGFAAQIGMKADPPAPFTGAVDSIWVLHFSNGRLFAGAKPAGLFVSDDLGMTWEQLEGLTAHPSASDWQPGAAGLVLHSIVTNPANRDHIWVGISAAGVFASEDGGATWDRRNQLSNSSVERAHVHPETGQCGHEIGHCVHNMQRATGDGDLLYQQNHHGVFRSPDGGHTWHNITAGLPSDFGFPIAVHPHDSQTLWTFPLNGDIAGRYPPDAAAAVWRSQDGGGTWQDLRNGLPQKGCYFTVLRQAMSVGQGKTPALAFGTNSGSVFLSRDDGDHWSEIAEHLPTVLGLEVKQVG